MSGLESILIDQRPVGPGAPPFVIAEVAQAHDGSLGAAHAYIELAAGSGAHAIKFQTHIADAESTPGEPFRVKFSPQDDSRFDYWKRMEFTENQWQGLAKHASDRGLVFLSSPFSFEALELLERIGIPAWKVASGEVANFPFIERIARSAKPVLLSSGLSGWSELDEAVRIVRAGNAPLAIMQCTTSYPYPPERLGLNVLAELRERYACPVGLSDHSAVTYAGLAAAALGANLIEVHVTFSRDCFGPDVIASLTGAELKELCKGVEFIHAALSHPVDKQAEAEQAAPLAAIFGKSVVLARDLSSGHCLRPNDLALKKPGTGIPAARLTEVVGRRLKRSLAVNTLLSEADLE